MITQQRQATGVLAFLAALYILVHCVVVVWLTFKLMSGLTALATQLFTIAGVDVRLWWLVAGLVICVIAASTIHAFVDSTFEGVEYFASGAAHLPAVFAVWGMAWSGGVHSIGTLVGNVLWSLLFLALILGSALFIVNIAERAGK